MTTSGSTHYVARLVIERVDITTVPIRGGAGPRGETTTTERKVGEVGNFTVKAPELDALKDRVAAHTNLVVDDTPLDSRRPGTRGSD